MAARDPNTGEITWDDELETAFLNAANDGKIYSNDIISILRSRHYSRMAENLESQYLGRNEPKNVLSLINKLKKMYRENLEKYNLKITEGIVLKSISHGMDPCSPRPVVCICFVRYLLFNFIILL